MRTQKENDALTINIYLNGRIYAAFEHQNPATRLAAELEKQSTLSIEVRSEDGTTLYTTEKLNGPI